MKIIKLLSITLLLLVTQTLVAQDFEIPKNVQLEQESDYVKYEKDVLSAINWLENTGIEEQKSKRQNTSAFVLKWIMGTPTFSIALNAFQIDLTKKNPDLLTSFLGGWSTFAIENPSEKEDMIKGNIAGFKSLIKVYAANKGNGMKKDKKIEKLMKLSPDELKAWIQKELQ